MKLFMSSFTVPKNNRYGAAISNSKYRILIRIDSGGIDSHPIMKKNIIDGVDIIGD